MGAHFEIRAGAEDKTTRGLAGSVRPDHLHPTHEWVALVGGNGETMMTSETYPRGHGNAERAVSDILAAIVEAEAAWTG